MIAKRRSALSVSVAAAVLALATLSACGASPGSDVPKGDYPAISLADTKSPAQLLRNTAVSRIPSEVILSVATQTDGSVSCLSEDEDPKGYIRYWESTVDVQLKLKETPNAQTIVDQVLASFTDEGWMSQQITGSAADRQAHLLTKGTASTESVSLAQVRMEAVTSGDKTTAYIHIDSRGPCVVTNGKDAPDVVELGLL
jgi:hypothetical protein